MNDPSKCTSGETKLFKCFFPDSIYIRSGKLRWMFFTNEKDLVREDEWFSHLRKPRYISFHISGVKTTQPLHLVIVTM